MDEASAKKSTSFESLVIQNISNVNELKGKLNDIIKTGKDYEYDVSSCLKSLLNSSDPEIVLLSVQSVSELAKCAEKRESYAQKEIIEPILNILRKDLTSERFELVKQCCRSLGNLCCDCDISRKIVLECEGIPVYANLIQRSLDENNKMFDEIKMYASKALLNFSIGGQEFTDPMIKNNIVELMHKELINELERDDMDDDMVSTTLLILSVIIDNTPEHLFDESVNITVLKILKETTNLEISELCLDHLHAQAEHDSVKILLANEGGIELVCARLEELVKRHDAGDLTADDAEIEAVMKQACDLVIIVLTGDEAMHKLYNNGEGAVFLTAVRWLDSTNSHLLTTAVLAIGNFARNDQYCVRMMQDNIYDKLLDIFEVYHGFHVRMKTNPDGIHPIDTPSLVKIQHAVLSAVRNLSVPTDNKRAAAAAGRAAPCLLGALPNVDDHHVAYKLLAAIRMLVDGQDEVASQLAQSASYLSGVSGWARAGEWAGAAGEAPRLLAWTARQGARGGGAGNLVQVEGCVQALVYMLVASHTIMQNEAILALTLLAIESFNKKPRLQPDFDYEKSFTTQLIASEIGKHIAVLIETNCAKMPVEVAENLLAFLDITSKRNKLALEYKESKVQDALQKFMDTRKDFSDDLKGCIVSVLTIISDIGKEE